jgi:hypothetical protein
MTPLDYFDGYVQKGLKPIAIHKESKRPIERQWNVNWSIQRWRNYFHDEKYNMGIILGDIIDVEADTKEAGILLEKLLGYSIHPKYSSSKSTHNLFINPDKSLTRKIIKGIEFRGNLHQSVVPPSLHEDGTKYAFLKSSNWPIPEMPVDLRNFYFSNINKSIVRKGNVRTFCNKCNKSFYIMKKRLALEVKSFQSFNLKWMCNNCRNVDIKQECRILRKELQIP